MSAKSSSAHEMDCAMLITEYLLRTKAVNALVWFIPSVSAQRNIVLSETLRSGVRDIVHGQKANGVHPFWSFYQTKSDGAPEEPWKLQQNHVDFDFFAYEDVLDSSNVSASEARNTGVYPVAKFSEPYKNRALDDSNPTDKRRACIFEVGESGLWEYKIAQLELRLALFLAKRRQKFEREDMQLDEVVAACGVCIPQQYHSDCSALLASPAVQQYLPSIAELHRQGKMHVLQAERRPVFPLLPPPPQFVWVAYSGHTLAVTPAINNVDSLKESLSQGCCEGEVWHCARAFAAARSERCSRSA